MFKKITRRSMLILLCLAGLSTAHAQTESVAKGVLRELTPVPEKPPAPEFTLTDTTGKTHKLSDYKGKVVMVNFWAVWCLPCRKEMPSMQRAWEQVQDKDVMMLAVNWGDTPESIKKFTDSLPPMDFPLLVGGDEAMTKEWGVRGLPTTYVINPEGQIAYKLVGETEWDKPEILDKVLALKSE